MRETTITFTEGELRLVYDAVLTELANKKHYLGIGVTKKDDAIPVLQELIDRIDQKLNELEAQGRQG